MLNTQATEHRGASPPPNEGFVQHAGFLITKQSRRKSLRTTRTDGGRCGGAGFCSVSQVPDEVSQVPDEVNERARDAYYLHRRQANEDIDQGAKLLYLFIDPALIAPPFAFLDYGVKNYARILRHMAYLADFVLTRVRLSS